MNKHTLRLKQHLHRWRDHFAASSFFIKEVSARLIERLAFIKIKPAVILNMSHLLASDAEALSKHYPEAKILNVYPAGMPLPAKRSWWKIWQKQAEAIFIETALLPLPELSVDLIYSNNFLYSCKDLPALLAEWFRVLKPGGLVLFTTLGPDSLCEWRAADPLAGKPSPFIDMHDLGDLLLQQRFTDPVMDMEVLRIFYPHFDQLLRDLRLNKQQFDLPVLYPGKLYWQQFAKNYLPDEEHKQLAVTCELVYGHAWKPIAPMAKKDEFSIPLTKIKRR